MPRPDLVVYLQAPTEVLMKRIRTRGRPEESRLSEEYLAEVNRAYNYYFFHYTQTPLLVVNTTDVDFVKSSEDLDDLISRSGAWARERSTTFLAAARAEPRVVPPESPPARLDDAFGLLHPQSLSACVRPLDSGRGSSRFPSTRRSGIPRASRPLSAREATRPLALTLTENRSVLLSFRRANGRVELRLHRMFLHAPMPVVQALARALGARAAARTARCVAS